MSILSNVFHPHKQYGIDGRNRGISRFYDGKTHTELASEQGNHCFAYALLSGEYSNADIATDAILYNCTLEVFQGTVENQFTQLIEEISQDFIVTKVAIVDDGNLCLRGYYLGQNEAHCVIKLTKPVTSANKVDLTGNIVQCLTTDGNSITFSARPFEIITLLTKR